MEWTLLFSRGTGYHKIHIPIIDAVSKHQPTTRFSFFFNLDILICSFPVSVWYCINKINDIRVFVFMQLVQCILRLMLTITPVVCMLAGVAFSTLLDVYLREDNTKPNTTLTEDEENSTEKKTLYDKAGKLKHRPKHDAQQHETGTGIGSNLKTFVILVISMILMTFAVHCTWVTSNADDARVMSWLDFGYGNIIYNLVYINV
ncbi:dolichyl-diphosphooligosaccharide--protein glycosyltransferase subunit STT3B-like isoform X1 [Glossina fuscipes]|uniref:dolichyl-diphosphooligosaccharide--protein glycotransferase n=2 Tax=Glossina fuscipes TaxID=7396 RepID=A0A9C5ZG13_9MUSC|nr:dolichyl-diphosphooligosaccharide--protein glycosyltransferase subunit STT3B-like isoform X1 [Glossina fuscipes]